MKTIAVLCTLLLVVAAACSGGGDDPAELDAAMTVEEVPAVPPETTSTGADDRDASPGDVRVHEAIVAQASATAAALDHWDDALASCIGPTGTKEDAGASCTRVAWEQLFDQLHVAHAEVLRLIGRTPAGPCHEALSSAVDAIHGFLSGATPTNVVWLDEQQRPPSRFDLEAIVDLARPAPVRLRGAVAAACPS